MIGRVNPRTRRGVTLLELLVAIGIIVVLIGMVLTAIRHVRLAAQRAGCLANLRSLHTATMLFMSDNNDLLPYADSGFFIPVYDEPYSAIARHLSVDAPMETEENELLTGAPFTCPTDRFFADLTGASYDYVPHHFMSAWASFDEFERQTGVTRMFRNAPHSPLYTDLGRDHRDGPTPGHEPPNRYYRNGVSFDGSADWLVRMRHDDY